MEKETEGIKDGLPMDNYGKNVLINKVKDIMNIFVNMKHYLI